MLHGQQHDIARQRFKVPPYKYISFKNDTGSLYEHINVISLMSSHPIQRFTFCNSLSVLPIISIIHLCSDHSSSHGSPKVDSVLSERITHFLERAYVLDREGRPESEVPLLQLLSKPIQRELRFARFEGCLRCWDQDL